MADYTSIPFQLFFQQNIFKMHFTSKTGAHVSKKSTVLYLQVRVHAIN